jgi:protein-disulfide isomerase
MSTLVIPVGPNDHVRGPAAAPVTLVEYGDYECPYCGEAYPVVRAVERHFGRSLRFVFRNFPLTQAHPHAEHAAEAAEAVGAQGKFWEMHDLLYTHQDALDDPDLLVYAGSAGADTAAVRDALAARTFAARVRDDFRGGVRSGVNGTPSFFINGARYDGAHDAASLTEAIATIL